MTGGNVVVRPRSPDPARRCFIYNNAATAEIDALSCIGTLGLICRILLPLLWRSARANRSIRNCEEVSRLYGEFVNM